MSKGVQRPSSVHLFFWTMKQCVGGQWRDFVAVLVKVRSWAINHQLTESQRPPLSLPLTLLLSLGGRRGSTVQGQGGWGGILFLYDCETVCSGSNEYFWWALPPCFFCFSYKYYHKCCYACMLFAREEGCRVFLFFFVHELKSQCWRRKTRWSVACLHSGGSKKEREPGMMCDAGWQQWRLLLVQALHSVWIVGEGWGGQSSPLQSTWVIYALCCVVLMVITCLSPLCFFFFFFLD